MGNKELAESGVQELRLFEFEGGPLIQVEVNLEEAPLFMFKRRDRHEESTEARNTAMSALALSRSAAALTLLQNLFETMPTRELKRRP